MTPRTPTPGDPIVTRHALDAESSPESPQESSVIFWEAGERSVAATQPGDDCAVETAIERCRDLLAEDLLPPLAELIDEAGHRRSELVIVASTAFAQYLIDWRGQRRYESLLRHVRAGRSNAFTHVYRRSLALVER